MSKIIETGSNSRVKLLRGVEQLADAVVVTLGPNGRNVVIAQQGGNLPQSTKDGVTVAKTIVLKDPVENLGAQMVKQAAVQTGDTAGDGTTTSTLLARELIKEGMKHTNLSQKHNAVEIKRGMEKTSKAIVGYLKEMSTDIAFRRPD
jgi:chaperonin GroEL